MQTDQCPAIRLERLQLCYGRAVAVDDLTLSVMPGELFGLLGPNGAGKSSTVRVLIGQASPTRGQVSVLGLDVQRDWQRLKPLFGYVPDRENHFIELSGRRNLLIFSGLYGLSKERVDECLAVVEMSEVADLPVRGYSLGMHRKLLLARALLHQPKVLYLDEPTTHLDVHSVELVQGILRTLARKGITVLITTHDMKQAADLCDRVALLYRGKLAALGPPDALRAEHGEPAPGMIYQGGDCAQSLRETFLNLTRLRFD